METNSSNLDFVEPEDKAFGNAEIRQDPEDDDFLPLEPETLKKHPFQCETCDKILTNKQSLKLHALTHLDPANRKTFRCEICLATYKSQLGLNYHLETKHIQGLEREKLPCPTCGRIFKSAEGRKIHMTIQHGAGGPIFKCKECPMVFARKPHLDLHMTTHGSGLHVCTTCGKSYARLKDLSRHEATCGVKELCCPVCGKQLRTEKALENHGKKCRSEGRNFRCLTCGQRFATEKALGSHEVVHRRAFRCAECPQTFVTVVALRNHEQTKHWETLGFEAGFGEKRGRPRKSDQGDDEKGKVRMRRSKYNPFIGLEHLADPSTLIEKENPVMVESKPADLNPIRLSCEHCSLTFATMKALENHGQRRHWEALGLAEPVPDRRGRKRTRPLGQVRKRIKRRRKIDNYVELVDLPEEVMFDAKREEVDPVKLEVAQHGEPTIDDPVEMVAIPLIMDADEVTCEPNERIEETTSNFIATNEVIIKEEIIEFGDYDFDHFEDDLVDGDPVVELTFGDIVADLEVSQEPVGDEVDTLSIEPAVGTNVSEEQHIFKELVICLEKLDYSKLVEPSSSKKRLPRMECEHCGRTFTRQYRLAQHRVKEHGSTEIPTKTKPPPKVTLPPSYHCKECGKSYQFKHYLRDHKAKVHGITEADEMEVSEPKDRSSKCDLCRNTYSFLHHLEAHYPVHPEYQNFKCDQCPKVFFKEDALVRHKTYTHASKKIRPFKPRGKNPMPRMACEHCGKTFAHQYHLALHRVTEHGSTETPVANKPTASKTLPRNFHCSQCDKSYYLPTNLAVHEAKVHGVGEAPPREETLVCHTCKHCKKQFTSWGGLIYHRKFIHGESIDKLQFVRCSSCLMKFLTDEEMAEHLCFKGIVRERERCFKCNLCDKAYFMKNHLEGHYSVHPEYHNCKCDLCPKGFFNESELKRHKKKAHIAIESYFSCKTCNQLFKSQQNLKRHQQLHSDHQYCCEHCGRKFKMQTNLKQHMYHVHAEYVSDAARAARAIPCTVCGKKFRGRGSFKAHMQTHNNDRPFKCSFPSCGKTFSWSANVKKHEQSHTKDYKFKCKICEYGTVIRKRILLHEQREHNFNRFAEVNDS